MNLTASRQLWSLCGKSKRQIHITSCAYKNNIQSKALRHPDYARPPPFDYINKTYPWYAAQLDKTSHRFDNNTRLIIVNGPFGVGKKELCRGLAEALDFRFEQDPSIDLAFKNNVYNIDYRDYHSVMPYRMRTPDLDAFYRDPFDDRVHLMQQQWYEIRLLAYIRALRHMYNTGQGVVMNGGVMSFHCIVKGMVDCGFLSKQYLKHVNELRRVQFGWLKRPHVMVYLDAPYEVCMQRIKDRNIPNEATSKFYSKKLHDSIANFYKEDYLDKAGEHAELLIYDWTEKQSPDDVVMDIEQLSFELTTCELCKQKDWQADYEFEYMRNRVLYTSEIDYILEIKEKVPPMNVPELWYSGEEMAQFKNTMEAIPYFKYLPGFNIECGDNYDFLFNSALEFKHDPLEQGRQKSYTGGKSNR